jgi:cobalt-zinc-cadmium efflux system outer membrane protein
LDYKNIVLLGTILCTAIAGCSTHQEIGQLPAEKRSNSHQLPDSARTAVSTANNVYTEPLLGELTLGKAVDLALERSPHLEAYRGDVLKSQALARQSGTWKNPVLEVEVEDYRSPGRQLALARAESVNWEFEAARLEVVMQVSRRFIHALEGDQKVDLAAEELELAEETHAVIEQLVQVGKASPVELVRFEVPLIEAEVELERERRNRDNAYRLLAMSWGSKEAGFDSLSGDLVNVQTPPDPQLLAEYISSNPEIARWSAKISEQVAMRRLALAEAIPDPSIRVGLKERDFPDEEAFVIGIELPLPIFDRQQGAMLAAREGERSARARKRMAELRIEGMLGTAWTRYSNAYHEALALREKALPASEEAFNATQLAYTEGKFGLLDVLDAQQTLFEMRHRYLEALVTCHLMIAEVEALIGQPLNSLRDTASPAKID